MLAGYTWISVLCRQIEDIKVFFVSEMEDVCHVLQEDGNLYSATLGLVDIVRGTNSYYKLQLLKHDKMKS